MLNCPLCQKALAGEVRRCPRCDTDLSLLVDYVQRQQEGLARAERLTRAGQLAAVWAYLEVLEVDAGNEAGRVRVGQVATAVRHFDGAAATRRLWGRGRRWLTAGRLKKIALATLILVLLLAGAFILGYHVGSGGGNTTPAEHADREEFF